MANEHEIHEDVAADIARSNSVVKSAYKAKYAERAANMARKPKGIAKKVLQRSNSDALVVALATACNDPKSGALDVPKFEAVLDANGVRHAHWNRTTRGWQGRLRMTGRLALERVVAEANGELVVPGLDEPVHLPRTWVQKHTH
jgi:hypothetical protein